MHATVLKYFCAVAEQGSIRKAAEALNIASSAVNRQILKMEEDLGVLLFERRPGGVHLTPAGRVMLRHIRETLFEYERAKAEIDDLRDLKTGSVRIAALGSLMVDFLPQAVEAFHHSYPGVNFEVLDYGPADVITAVASGRADIGLTFTLLAVAAVRVVAEKETPIGAVMAADHPLAGRSELTLQECAAYPLLLQPERLPYGPASEAAFADAGLAVAPTLVSDSLPMTKHVLHARMGVAFFTRLGFRQEIDRGELVHIPLQDPSQAPLKVGIMVAARRRLTPASVLMLESLEERMADL